MRVVAHRGRAHPLDRNQAFLVPELAHVEVALDRVRPFGRDPAQKDVAGRLSKALALDDALAVMLELRRRGVGLEHRGPRLLDLKKQGVPLVTSDEQGDPGAGAHAPRHRDLAGCVNERVGVEDVAALVLERRAIAADHVAQASLGSLQL